ncbi:MAG: type II toxin-antitoxin system Phd/YefM family antitoxin [Actinobacteria bacterium]|nr:type II toxin-antitoxin system Phd/YefM family antitoxin [Actinomycetota bacterium]
MADARVPASVFKARCLALFDEVATTHRPLLVTKHGQPVARVIPIETAAVAVGSVTLLSDDEGDYFSTAEAWRGDS